MSAASAAVLRSACRAFRRRPSNPPHAAALVHKPQQPHLFRTRRFHHTSDCASKAEMNQPNVASVEALLLSSKLDQIIGILSRKEVMLKELKEASSRKEIMLKELNEVVLKDIAKRTLRRRVMVLGSIFVGLPIYLIRRRFSGGTGKENKQTAGSN